MFFNRYLLNKGAIAYKSNINPILYKIVIGIIDTIIDLDVLFLSLTNLDIAVGRESVQSVIKRLNVGKTRLYKPIPSVPTVLVKAILIIIESIFVIKPPIIKIIVDLIKVFFMYFTNSFYEIKKISFLGIL